MPAKLPGEMSCEDANRPQSDQADRHTEATRTGRYEHIRRYPYLMTGKRVIGERELRDSVWGSRCVIGLSIGAIRAARQDADPGRRYRLAGLLRCGICGRRAESCWSNGRSAYRCRHGHSSASAPDPGRPRNLYIREDRILPHLPALHLLLAGAEPAAGRRRRRTRHGADVNRPAGEEDAIGYLRTRQIALTSACCSGTPMAQVTHRSRPSSRPCPTGRQI